MDASPPVAGHVYDGKRTEGTGKHKDVDYVSDMEVIHAYWEGFHDPHTPIREYLVRVGSCERCGDIMSQQPVGLDNGNLLL